MHRDGDADNRFGGDSARGVRVDEVLHRGITEWQPQRMHPDYAGSAGRGLQQGAQGCCRSREGRLGALHCPPQR